MNRPLVSVIIPTRDRAELLTTALAAILAQARTDLEVIVVDDGSRDRTPEVIEEARAADPRVRSLRNERSLGAAAARNAGAAEGRGEYLLFEDDDCRSRPDRVTRMLRALGTAPNAGYAYCWMEAHSTDGSVRIHGRDGPWSIGTPCALIRRAHFEQVLGFDAGLPRLQDFDLWTRLLAKAPAIEVPEVLLTVTRSDQGISASTDRLIRAAHHIFEKYEESSIAPGHLAAMHRRLGGKLMVLGHPTEGMAHFRRSLALYPLCPRTWLAVVAARAGVRAYRAVARAHYRLQKLMR